MIWENLLSDNAVDFSILFGSPLRETCYGYLTQEQYEARRADEVLREAVRSACILCDAKGYRPNGLVCDHIDRTETARRGSQQVRDVLDKLKRPANG